MPSQPPDPPPEGPEEPRSPRPAFGRKGSTKWPRGRGNRRKFTAKVDIEGEILRANRRKMVAELKGQGLTWEAVRLAVSEVLKMPVSDKTVRNDLAVHLAELKEQTGDHLRSGYDAVLRGVLETHFGQARKGSQRSAEVVIKAVKEHSAIFGARLDTDKLAAAAAGAGSIDVNVNVHEALLAKLDRVAAAVAKNDAPDSGAAGADAAREPGKGNPEP